MNYYSFPIIKKEKWLKGAKTKYDIPQYIEGIPEGFAIFCTTKEAGKVRKYQEQIEKRKNRNNKNELKLENDDMNKDMNEDINRDVEDMDVINKRIIAGAMNNLYKKNDENENNKNNDKIKDKNKEEENKELKLSDELQEPIPRNDHKYCHICKTKFEKYLKHIKCYSHFENLQKHQTFFNCIKKSFDRIIYFWDIKNGRTPRIKNRNNSESNKNENDSNVNIIISSKTFNQFKSEEISTKELSIHENKFLLNNININNHKANNSNNNENINNNIKNNNAETSLKNNNNNIFNSNINVSKKPLNNNTNNNINNTMKVESNISISNKTEDKKVNNNNNVVLNQNKNILSVKNNNENHIFNLTHNNNMNNKGNENTNNTPKTINYINISKKEGEKLNENNPEKSKSNQIYKEEKPIAIKPKNKFVTKSYPKFSTLQTYQIPKPKKRKKNEFYKGGDIFVISTPKKFDFDYFPIITVDNPKKLINKNIIFFQ